MTGRTNASSVGGGLDFSKAIIHATAPTGSTLTFLLNGIARGTLQPSDSIPNADDSNYSDYFFEVAASDYGTWTVESSPARESRTVTVNSVGLYHVYVVYDLYLYNSGIYTQLYGHETYASKATITDMATQIRIVGNGSAVQVGYIYWNSVDLSAFDTVTLIRTPGNSTNRFVGIFITQDDFVKDAMSASIKYHTDTTGSTGQPTTQTLDISGVSGFWRVGVGFDTNGGSWVNARTEYVDQVKLS